MLIQHFVPVGENPMCEVPLILPKSVAGLRRLTLKASNKNAADDILIFFTFTFRRK